MLPADECAPAHAHPAYREQEPAFREKQPAVIAFSFTAFSSRLPCPAWQAARRAGADPGARIDRCWPTRSRWRPRRCSSLWCPGPARRVPPPNTMAIRDVDGGDERAVATVAVLSLVTRFPPRGWRRG